MKIPLKIKGSRNYIQGGDFFDGVNSLLLNEDILEISFRNFTLNECCLEKNKTEHTIATLKTNREDYYINKTGSMVVEKIEYKEELMIANSSLYDSTIKLDEFISGFTSIEHIIALTKELNNKIDPLESSKWVFAQLKLKKVIPENFETISISSEQRISKKFSKNRIIINGQDMGIINFIVGQA